MDIIVDADLAKEQGLIVLCLPLIPQTCMTARHYGLMVEEVTAELIAAADEMTEFAAAMQCALVASPVQVFPSSFRRYKVGDKKSRAYTLLGVTLRCSPQVRTEEVIEALFKAQEDSSDNM